MIKFTLDPVLQNDTLTVDELNLSRLLLHKNAGWPWFILVPRIPGLVEYIDLDPEYRVQLDKEIDMVSRFIKSKFKCDKLNIAGIGNVVSQLHIHVIGRHTEDPAWPGVVWGFTQKTTAAYSKDKIEEIMMWFQEFKTGLA